ncbi:MAG TPA: rRNA maturation RNase YbeY [Bacteroidia bacterium]|nr:rRNA maturation RNase YbeY [Bacteroidia bacterium]HNT79538.1 rRNA maturation RNase YbeY [Bacteroidia bacterium]
MAILFFKEKTKFRLSHRAKLPLWIKQILHWKKHKAENINFIFCNDKVLLDINRKYLNHNYLTDIITFDQSEKPKVVSADIYISIDRVIENATRYNVSFNDELHRVMAHGILHLMGYSDKGKANSLVMRQMEDKCLTLRSF